MWIIILLVLLNDDAHAQNMPDLKSDPVIVAQAVTRVDKGCLQLEQHGPCVVGEIPGVWISYYEPTLVIRTIGNKSKLNSLTGSNLQFHEVHLYDFPLKQMEQMMLCGSLTNNTVGLRFLSETDVPKWRSETCSPSDFIGNWGPLYPRTGFVTHYSPAVASALTALRGISAAGILSGHRSQVPILYTVNQWRDKIQMVIPKPQQCMALGADPRLWDMNIMQGHQDYTKGEYAWIYWKFTECCKTAVPIPTSL